MIIANGCDIIELERIKKALARAGFAERVYTVTELNYARAKGEERAVAALAAAWAAKEAIAKALGCGFGSIAWQDIEIKHEESGRPYAVLANEAFKRAQEMGVKKIHLSLSHSKEYAIATVILEG